MMLNTSSSEEENPQFSAKYSGSSTDAHSRWQNHEFKNMRTLDLRSRRSEYDADQKLRSEPDSAKFARIPLGGASSSSCGWQPLKVESGGRSELLPNEPQRAPRLYTIAGARTSVAEQGYPHEIPSGMEDVTAKNYQFNQFSSSFEGNSESGPIGTRLSPIGSSCWSSEQHISPDLASLVSGSTNSFSAGRSTSSGKQPYITSSLTQHLQRQHSGVYSGVILSHEPYSIQSASQSVRSAPLCITANQTHPICARQLTIDASDSINDNPTPPSLLVSDPEEEAHKRILQLYVFASRCIAYPVLNPVYPGPSRRYLKVTKDYLLTLKERIQLFLKGEYPINCDEAFQSAVGDFFEVVLESDRIASMVKSGACSMYDIREIFIAFIEKRFQNEHVNEGLSKENVIGSWKVKFDQICRGGERPCPVAMKLAVPQPEIVAPTKEQQYELLMRTLSVEKYEHQVLYNACQLDNADEQAACLRRELAQRLLTIDTMIKERSFPKLLHKEMECQYIEEEKLRVNELIRRLDSIPVMKGYTSKDSGQPQKRMRKGHARAHHVYRPEESRTNTEVGVWNNSHETGSASVSETLTGSPRLPERMNQATESHFGVYQAHGINREAIRMRFEIEILIHQLRNVLQMSASKKLYFTIELEGSSEKKRTDSVEAAKPLWNTTAEFQTHQPLPVIRLRLYKECSGALALEDKELGRLTLHPSWLTTRTPTWFRLQANKHCHDTLEVQLTVSMQRPANCRYANYCWIQGRTAFKKWKRRYLCLIQVSQYTFVIAAYAEQKSHPSEFMALDGFTVDYCENRPDLVFASSSVRSKPEHHMSATSLTSLSKLRFGGFGRLVHQHRAESAATMCGPEPELKATYFLKLVREGDTVIMATSTDVDRQSWIQTIYRATGQTHKPAIPNHLTIGTPTRLFTGESEAGHATGIEELASKPPHAFCHVELFTELQARSLSYRLQDSFVSLGWLSPGQKILLEEYCSRYGIRECQRHLAYLTSLLDKAEHGMKVDPDLLHISYSICANHVTGKTFHDQAVRTVLAAERDQFQVVKQRLTTLLEKQITEFRYCFPFGRPEGALEKTIGLLERVLSKETGEPASADIVRNAIKMCLRNAAVLNYERISEYATIEALSGIRLQGLDAKKKKVFKLIRLAELCIEVLKQNEEHHAESFSWFSDLFAAHSENFWSLFQMDLFDSLDQLEDCEWEIFDLFQVLNEYLLGDSNLCGGTFHQSIANRFAPLVDRYIEATTTSIEQAMMNGFENERWSPSGTVIGSGASFTVSAPCQPNKVSKEKNALTSRVQRYSATSCRSLLSANLPESHRSVSVASEQLACPENQNSVSGGRACQTATELLWRLQRLRQFITDLSWPQTKKAQALDEQTRVLCAHMLREAVKRTLVELESMVRKCGKSTDLILPIECCTMMNTITELRSHLFILCRALDVGCIAVSSPRAATTTQTANQLHIETEEFFEGVQRTMLVIVMEHLVSVLQGVLGRLTRFDENRILSSFLSLTKSNDEGRRYTTFLHSNLQQLSENMVDEVSLISLCETWYTRQMRIIYEWLIHRKNMLLHPHQTKCLSTIVKKIFCYFELQGLSNTVLDTIVYRTVSQRLQVEETTQSVKQESNNAAPSGVRKRRLLDNLSSGLSAWAGGASLHRS